MNHKMRNTSVARNQSNLLSQCPKIKSQLTIVPCATLVCPAVPCPAPVLRPSPLLHLHTLCLYETWKTWMFYEKFIFHKTNKQTIKKNTNFETKKSINRCPPMIWIQNICPTNHLIWLTTNYNLDAEPHQRFICLNHKPKKNISAVVKNVLCFNLCFFLLSQLLWNII